MKKINKYEEDNIVVKVYGTWKHLGDENCKLIIAYIKEILQDAQFQKNPRQYLLKWERDRGGEEILKIPADCAYRVLNQLVNY